MYWDPLKTTYVLAPASSDNGNGYTAAASAQVSFLKTGQSSCSNVYFQTQPPPPPAEEKDVKKQKDQPQDKVKVAKKIVKDMEK